MRDREVYTAYRLGVTMNTMNSLLNRDLIERADWNELVWLGWEATEMTFAITQKGLETLRSIEAMA